MAEERAEIVEYCLRMDAAGLTVGTSGNVSVRWGDLVAITPTGVDYATLTAEQVSVVDSTGRPVAPGPRPSSELPMHLAVYRETAAGAVVHTHPPVGTALSTVVDELPGIHYLVMRLGGPVRVAPYAPYGSPELAEAGARAMAGRSAVLCATTARRRAAGTSRRPTTAPSCSNGSAGCTTGRCRSGRPRCSPRRSWPRRASGWRGTGSRAEQVVPSRGSRAGGPEQVRADVPHARAAGSQARGDRRVASR